MSLGLAPAAVAPSYRVDVTIGAGCGSTRRVRKMRLVNPVRPWVPCYRTTDAPTIQPSIEWLRTRNTPGYVASLNTIRSLGSI
jgi:hypothetical protein